MNTPLTQSPIGVIDVGSNSIKLLLATIDTQSLELQTLDSRTLTERISRGISQNPPRLAEESMALGARCIASLVDIAREKGATHIDIVATSAVRDAVNRNEFIEKVRALTGITMRVLSGDEEAQAIGRGLLLDPRIRTSSSVQVIDLGGGSMEYLLFKSGVPVQIHSYQLGSVRLTEQANQVGMTPDHPEFILWVTARVQDALAGPPACMLGTYPETPLYGAGGSLYSMHQLATHTGMLNGDSLSMDLLLTLFNKILPMSFEERAALPGVQAGRADILPTAIATIYALCKIGRRPEISLCPFNLRFGLAAEKLGARSVAPTSHGDLQ